MKLTETRSARCRNCQTNGITVHFTYGFHPNPDKMGSTGNKKVSFVVDACANCGLKFDRFSTLELV